MRGAFEAPPAPHLRHGLLAPPPQPQPASAPPPHRLHVDRRHVVGPDDQSQTASDGGATP
jgi:hypothetical protein